MEAAVGPGVARLLQRLAALRPQAVEIGRADVGLDLDHLAVDLALVGEDVARRAVGLDGADAQARHVEIGLAQKAPGHARCLRELLLERAVVLQHKLAFVFDRHARIATMSSQTIDDLPTPALILDRAILSRNLKRMSDRLRNAGVMLRPHLKTAKSVEIGRMAVEGHDGRITVSTLAEARYFAEGGFTDILYGVGIVPVEAAGDRRAAPPGRQPARRDRQSRRRPGDRRGRDEWRYLLGADRDRQRRRPGRPALSRAARPARHRARAARRARVSSWRAS